MDAHLIVVLPICQLSLPLLGDPLTSSLRFLLAFRYPRCLTSPPPHAGAHAPPSAAPCWHCSRCKLTMIAPAPPLQGRGSLTNDAYAVASDATDPQEGMYAVSLGGQQVHMWLHPVCLLYAMLACMHTGICVCLAALLHRSQACALAAGLHIPWPVATTMRVVPGPSPPPRSLHAHTTSHGACCRMQHMPCAPPLPRAHTTPLLSPRSPSEGQRLCLSSLLYSAFTRFGSVSNYLPSC